MSARRRTASLSVVLPLFCLLAAPLLAQSPATPADLILTNARIYTADSADRFVTSLAIRDGRIFWLGSAPIPATLSGPKTQLRDLHGAFLMPGLIDGHMHPLEAGTKLLECNLDYLPLTIPHFQQRIQACLNADTKATPDTPLPVVAWFQQAMLPEGIKTSRLTLDALETTRPILVTDSFGHTVLVNSRALALAHITAASKDPLGGIIEHEPDGQPSGLLQDSASDPVYALLPTPTPAQNNLAALAALKAVAAQGVTSFLDADATEDDLAAFTSASANHQLTARAHFAMHIEPAEADHPELPVARILGFRAKYDQGPLTPTPSITVRNAKMYMDGVISGPAFTGAMLEPYLVNTGTPGHPAFTPGTRGPDPYYPPARLAALLTALAKAGIDPHLHVDGDRAVHEALDAVAAMRQALPTADIRPGFAHCEIVAPADYPRFRQLGVYPALSMQWEKQAPDTLDQLRDYMGPTRAQLLEPAGVLLQAGAPVAFGSDWPVDPLNEWFALKVGVTRLNDPAAGEKYTSRLGSDPGLTVLQALRASTITAAAEIHQDAVSGSLEPGKFADIILLDRDPFAIAPIDLAHIRVLETIVGGRTVYTAP